jgi:hypothetical protein
MASKAIGPRGRAGSSPAPGIVVCRDNALSLHIGAAARTGRSGSRRAAVPETAFAQFHAWRWGVGGLVAAARRLAGMRRRARLHRRGGRLDRSRGRRRAIRHSGRLGAASTAATGSGPPTRLSTRRPAARERSRSAVSGVQSGCLRSPTSGISKVNSHGPCCALRRTSVSSRSDAAVRFATTSTRLDADSISHLLDVPSARRYAHSESASIVGWLYSPAWTAAGSRPARAARRAGARARINSPHGGNSPTSSSAGTAHAGSAAPRTISPRITSFRATRAARITPRT